jgi:hypothetical protein
MGTAGYYLIEVWLTNTNTDPNDESGTIPDDPQVTRWRKSTDSAGLLSIDIEYSGAHTWYANVVVLGAIGISDALLYT